MALGAALAGDCNRLVGNEGAEKWVSAGAPQWANGRRRSMGTVPKSSPSQHTHLRFLRHLDWKIKARIKENIKNGRFGWLETSQEVVTRQSAVTMTEKPP